MANKHRGEIDVRLNGRTYPLCLTLGALAELESAFGDEDMLALAARFESGRLRSNDAIRIIGAGLRGAGQEISDEAVAAMRCDDGAAGYVAIVAELLQATFGGGPAQASEVGPTPGNALAEGRGGDPFPGTT